MNIKQRINSRKKFVSLVLNSKILENPIVITDVEEEVDMQFLQQLTNTYMQNEESINNFIQEKIKNKLLDALQQSIISCGICELIIGTESPLVIKEYMIISDKLGSNAALVNASLDTYFKTYILPSKE